ncbi:MAG: hypothetical protein PF447_03540 [Spirochaetaceae bacterium]|jgi:hypothetical protein|nr:hypothetical protein [Spirochaetaceae bacterium]
MKGFIFIYVFIFSLWSISGENYLRLNLEIKESLCQYNPQLRWQGRDGTTFFADMTFSSQEEVRRYSAGFRWKKNLLIGPLSYSNLQGLLTSDHLSWSLLNGPLSLSLQPWQNIETNHGIAFQSEYAGGWTMQKRDYVGMGVQCSFPLGSILMATHKPTQPENFGTQSWWELPQNKPEQLYHGMGLLDFSGLGMQFCALVMLSDYTLPGGLMLAQGHWKSKSSTLELQTAYCSPQYRNARGELLDWQGCFRMRSSIPLNQELQFKPEITCEFIPPAESQSAYTDWGIEGSISYVPRKNTSFELNFQSEYRDLQSMDQQLSGDLDFYINHGKISTEGTFDYTSEEFHGAIECYWPWGFSLKQKIRWQNYWYIENYYLQWQMGPWTIKTSGLWQESIWVVSIKRTF